LARLDSINALRAWRDVVVDAARPMQPGRPSPAASFTAWAAAILEGLPGMLGNGTLPLAG
jgi:TetR/AcrR family transcriptional repressor of nem operon